MTYKFIISATLVVIAIVIGFFSGDMKNKSIVRVAPLPSVSPDPYFATKPAKTKQVMSWIPYWDQERAFSSFERNSGTINYLSFFWYTLDSQGAIEPFRNITMDKQMVDTAHAKGAKVFVLIANLPNEAGQDWDHKRVDRVIGSSTARAKHIEEIMALLSANGFDGVNIDYEALQPHQKENFSLFIEELSTRVHAEGKEIAVALHPKTSENNPEESYGAHGQDWQRIGRVVDQFHLMTYEMHNTSSEPGPTGSLSWMEEVLQYAIRDNAVPSNRIFLGIPLYGYDWEMQGNNVRTATGWEYKDIEAIVAQYRPSVQFDHAHGESYFTYTKNRREHQVWFNDAQSTRVKLELAQKYGVGGIGLWRIGGEDAEVWNAIAEYKN